MSVQSISFWQQDRSYWTQQQAQTQSLSASDTLISDMGQLMVNQAKGLASIANEAALKRVNSQISALVQSALQSSSGSTSSSAPPSGSSGAAASASSASSSGAASSAGAPATATGTVPVTTATSLATLGILPNGTITISDGTNSTTYTSTGTDTIGDLLNAVNIDLPTNANVTAAINNLDQLVFTARNDTDTITVGGTGNDAAAIGFGTGNTTFQPTAPSASSAGITGASTSSTSASSTTGSSASGSTASSTSTKTAASLLPSSLALAEQNGSTAASILSASGVTGTLVNLLA
jgi:hypothetical protein